MSRETFLADVDAAVRLEGGADASGRPGRCVARADDRAEFAERRQVRRAPRGVADRDHLLVDPDDFVRFRDEHVGEVPLVTPTLAPPLFESSLEKIIKLINIYSADKSFSIRTTREHAVV